MTFAQKLRAAREKAGLTQFELAVATGISLSAIQKWEGGTNEPRLKDFLVLCDFFDDWVNPLTRVVLKGRVPAYAA